MNLQQLKRRENLTKSKKEKVRSQETRAEAEQNKTDGQLKVVEAKGEAKELGSKYNSQILHP